MEQHPVPQNITTFQFRLNRRHDGQTIWVFGRRSGTGLCMLQNAAAGNFYSTCGRSRVSVGFRPGLCTH